jgi:cytochrome P450
MEARVRTIRTSDDLPALPRRVFFGNALEFARDRLSLFLRVQELSDVAVLHLGRRRIVAVSNPEVIQKVLVEEAEHFERGRNFEFYKILLGLGLLTIDTARHKRDRRLVAPALSHKRVASYATIMSRIAEETAMRWQALGNVDVSKEMMRLTLAIVGHALFSTDVDADASDVGEAMSVVNAWVSEEMARIQHVPTWVPLPRNVRMRRAVKRLDAVIHGMIQERRASGEDRGDVLSMLLTARDEDGSGLSDELVRDQAMSIFVAGHETTANALAWTFKLLGEHPQELARVHAEVDAALGGRTPTVEDVPHLGYVAQVFKEAMRLYPSAYALPRLAQHAVDLGRFVTRPGEGVMINLYGLHRRPDFYPEPDRFDPNRFLPANEKKLPRNAWLPFGGGARICIGSHFAMMEGILVLATLLQRVTFNRRWEGDIKPEPLVTIRPRGGVPITVTPRRPT